MPGDISDPARCRNLVERTVTEFGRIDVLVNNAAHQTFNEGLDDIAVDDVETSFKVNVFAMIWLAQAAVTHMEPGASIVSE